MPSFEACAVVPPFEGRAVVTHVVEQLVAQLSDFVV